MNVGVLFGLLYIIYHFILLYASKYVPIIMNNMPRKQYNIDNQA